MDLHLRSKMSPEHFLKIKLIQINNIKALKFQLLSIYIINFKEPFSCERKEIKRNKST